VNRQSPEIALDLFDTLRTREAQARAFGARHLVPVADTDSMLYWLALAAKQAREARERIHVHIAARAGKGVDQSTISRFENHTAWPDKLETILDGYAEDLDVDQFDIWAAAVELWRQYRALSPSERAAWEAEQTAARRNRGRPRANGRGKRAPRRDTKGR